MTEPSPASGAPASPEGADPSMEEILASIRRILNEEAPQHAEATAPDAPAPEQEPGEDDVLVLDRTMLVSAPPAAETPEAGAVRHPPPVAEPAEATAHPPVDPHVDPPGDPIGDPLGSSVARADREPDEPMAAHDADPAPAAFSPALMGPATAAAAASAVGGLVRTLTASRGTQVYGGGPTIEDLVREELRPLLKDWLDMHLPPLVERLVRTEIERVVGRIAP